MQQDNGLVTSFNLRIGRNQLSERIPVVIINLKSHSKAHRPSRTAATRTVSPQQGDADRQTTVRVTVITSPLLRATFIRPPTWNVNLQTVHVKGFIQSIKETSNCPEIVEVIPHTTVVASLQVAQIKCLVHNILETHKFPVTAEVSLTLTAEVSPPGILEVSPPVTLECSTQKMHLENFTHSILDTSKLPVTAGVSPSVMMKFSHSVTLKVRV
jgi:hypothetical protein